MLISILQAIAGVIVLALTFAFAEPVSLGTALGVLLLLSAAVRYAMAHDRSHA